MTQPSPGTQLGPYRIEALLGAGGMGQVYKARDTRLDRPVAIKISHQRFSGRFEQEARAISALNHPHICTLYDVGPNYLVMELVEGETLDSRLKKGRLAMDAVLRYGAQIADALAAAHSKGIVHRDLKPANIILTKAGVKVLDFGLAKHASASDDTLTASHAIMGTPAYMAPEQLEGKPCDARTDIFALGLVLYEMATGQRVKVAQKPAATMADLPAQFAHVVERCLESEPENRWQSARDLKAELEWAGNHQGRTPVPVRRSPPLWLWAVATLVAAALAVYGIVLLKPGSARDPGGPYLLSILLPEGMSMKGGGNSTDPVAQFALSPDGRRLVFAAASAGGRPQLWIRSLDAMSPKPLPGTDGAGVPFWSPDGGSIALFAQDKLKKIDLSGGPPVTLAEAQGQGGGAWNQENVILFARLRSGLYRVSSSGGEPAPVTTLDSAGGESYHSRPAFLPDGKHFVYLAFGSRTGGPFDPRGLYLGSLGSKDRKLLLESGSNAHYAGGLLVYLRQSTLMAQPFDLARLELTGTARVVAEQVLTDGSQVGAFSVSPAGILAYRTGSAQVPSQLIWFDRSGKQLEVLGGEEYYVHPEISPDGRRLAVAVLDRAAGTRDLWLFDLTRGVPTRFTFGATEERFPTWSPDGKRICFTSGREGSFNIYVKASNGSGAEQLLWRDSLTKYPTSWSPDGRFILYETGQSTPGTGVDLWVLPLVGDRKPFPYRQTAFVEAAGRFSPDGHWVAYRSNESGRFEVYVAPFPPSGETWQISTDGGGSPRWRADGREIYYMSLDNKLMAAVVNGEGSTFKLGPARPLFDVRSGANFWTATGDGQRFLVNTRVGERSAAPITVFVNWTAGLSKLP